METVTILLSTYNGEKYLQEQLDSLYKQEGVNVRVIVRDDGSTDGTHQILEANRKNGKLEWYSGENLKPAWSFMELLYNAPDSDFYAFCDQDDVWLQDKLVIAVNSIKKYETNTPTLYYGHPRLVDAELNPIESAKSSSDRMLDFYSAMINSNATGCTMVFNRALKNLVEKKKPEYIAMHDGWIHKVCIIADGNLIYDEDVHINYRQHGNNVIGSSNSMRKKINQRVKSLKNKECIRSRTIVSLLECYGDFMSPEQFKVADCVAHYRDNVMCKIRLLFCGKVKTSYARRNLLFRLAVLFGVF